MGSLFGAKPSLPQAPAPVPQRDTTDVANAALQERRRRGKSKGAAASVLTSGVGDLAAGNTAAKTLLG